MDEPDSGSKGAATAPDGAICGVEVVDSKNGFYLGLTAGGNGVVVLESEVIAGSPIPADRLESLTFGAPLSLETDRGRLEIKLEPVGEPIRIDGNLVGKRTAHRVVMRGTLADRDRNLVLDGHGVIHSASRPPSAAALRRDLTVMLDEGGLLLVATAGPDGSWCHGEEETVAAVSHPGGYLDFERALISTESDPDGRQRRATLELWPAGEDVAVLHGAGHSVAGITGHRPAATVNTALFRWSLDGHAGSGRYELTRPERKEEADR